jgi:hypothetical protein
LHGRGAGRPVGEPDGLVPSERAGPRGVLNFCPHNARGDPRGVGEGLSAKHRRGGAGRARHDREQVAHPIEDHNGDAMRCAKPQGLNAHEPVPAGHDDGRGHSCACVVSQAAFAVMDKERAALDGEAGVVRLRRDDAGLDRETRAPEGVGLGIRGGVDGVRSGRDGRLRLRRWAEPLMSLQDGLKRRSRVWPRGRGSIVLVGPERRRFAVVDRRDDRRRVEWIASWTPHGSPRLFFRRTGKSDGRARV